MVGFTIIENCVRFSEKVIQMMGMEATVHIISHGHLLTNTKHKEGTSNTFDCETIVTRQSHCLVLHCIAGIHMMATFNIVTGAKVKINESNI